MPSGNTSGHSVPKSIYEPDGLYLADGIAGLRALPPGSVDMLLTDPPYGTTDNYWDVPLPLPEFWAAARHAVKPNGAILMFAQCPYDKILGASNLKMLRYEWIWYKEKASNFFNAKRAPLKKSENILVFYQKLPKYNPQFEYREPYKRLYSRGGSSSNWSRFIRTGGMVENDGRRYPSNVLAFSCVSRTIHPTQKPVELFEYLIKTYTGAGELVVDICAGSGTAAVASINTGRRFLCFENAPEYFAVANERIRKERESTCGQNVPVRKEIF